MVFFVFQNKKARFHFDIFYFCCIFAEQLETIKN